MNGELAFGYVWRNPHPDAYAVATVSAILGLNGFCSTHSEGGFNVSNSARLYLQGGLRLFPTWTASPPLPQSNQWVVALDIHSVSEAIFFAYDHTNPEAVFREFWLRYDQLFVPPRQGVTTEVTLRITAAASGGTVHADFATGEFSVQSPFVQLAFVTA